MALGLERRPNTIRRAILALALFLSGAVPAAAAPWLFVSDIHLEAARGGRRPASFGEDTNRALFASALREMQRVDPHPPVVVVAGDLLAHDVTRAQAIPTAVEVARRLDRAFPAAQFLLTLGNDDSGCGDYALAPDAAFLRAVTAAWEPLVDRHGAAPGFARTFPRDGFYTATLPGAGLQAVVVDDVFWSPRYRASCGPGDDAPARALAELDGALRAARGPLWVLVHIPPGIDAFTTAHLVHRLAVVPLLDPGPRARFDAAVTGSGRVALVVAGHLHRFTFRVLEDGGRAVPLLVVPAIPPIFWNGPSFLTADVAPDGTFAAPQERSYAGGAWRDAGGFGDLAVHAFTAPDLLALQRRLQDDRRLRRRYARLYVGEGRSEIDDADWPVYRCAAIAFRAAAFRRCEGAGGYSVLTRRGLRVLAVALAAALALLIAILAALRRWRVRRGRMPG